jgi:hypothetical protein
VRNIKISKIRPVLLIDIPIVLMCSSIFSTVRATTINNNIPMTISEKQAANSTNLKDVALKCCTPLLLAPIAISGSYVYIVWPSNLTGNFEILFRASSDNGQTFTDKLNLSNTKGVDSIDPQISTSNNNVYVSWWEDYGNGTRIPFFRSSDDNGHSFEPVLKLTDNGPLALNTNNTNKSH